MVFRILPHELGAKARPEGPTGSRALLDEFFARSPKKFSASSPGCPCTRPKGASKWRWLVFLALIDGDSGIPEYRQDFGVFQDFGPGECQTQ